MTTFHVTDTREVKACRVTKNPCTSVAPELHFTERAQAEKAALDLKAKAQKKVVTAMKRAKMPDTATETCDLRALTGEERAEVMLFAALQRDLALGDHGWNRYTQRGEAEVSPELAEKLALMGAMTQGRVPRALSMSELEEGGFTLQCVPGTMRQREVQVGGYGVSAEVLTSFTFSAVLRGGGFALVVPVTATVEFMDAVTEALAVAGEHGQHRAQADVTALMVRHEVEELRVENASLRSQLEDVRSGLSTSDYSDDYEVRDSFYLR